MRHSIIGYTAPSQTSELESTITPTFASTSTPTLMATPTLSQTTPTPAVIPTSALTLPPAFTPTTLGLPDPAWTGTPSSEPLSPIEGERLHIKGIWRNTGSVATPSGFNIRLEIRRGNSNLFDQNVKVSQPVKPLEEGTLDVTPEYVIPQPCSYQVVLTLDSEAVITESSKDNNATIINLLEVPELSQEPGFNKYPEDITALAQAEKDIEKYRKGDIALTIVDAAGRPRSGFQVEYRQTDHSFLFGANTGIGDEKVWSLFKEAGINYTAVNVYCSSVEPTPGVFQLGSQRTALG